MKDKGTKQTTEKPEESKPILKIWRMLNSEEQEATKETVTELERQIAGDGNPQP